MREKIKENRAALFCIILLSAGMIVCLARMVKPGNSWVMGPDDLIIVENAVYFDAGVINENTPGWYVDNSMQEKGIFVQTPAINLPAGSYEITISYQAQGDGSKYKFLSSPVSYRVLLGRDDMPLEPGRMSKTMTANYLRQVKDFQVSMSYGGEGYLIVNKVEVKQVRNLERMILFALIMITAVAILGGWAKSKNRGGKGKLLFWSLGVATVATLPLFMPYLYRGDDLYFHLLRIEGIAEGLKTGQFPVRIQPEWMNGYGYPVSIFYGDGVLWIAGVLRLIGFPLQLSYKIYLYVINLITFAIAFFCLRRIIKDENIAIAGGIFYTFAPYRLMNIYVRGAVGEFTALTFLPLILVGTWEILQEKERKKSSWLLLTLGMTGIIQSHILTCEIVVILLGITCLIFWKNVFKKDCFLNLWKAAFITILINLWFLLPFLDFMREDLLVNSAEFDGYIQTSGTFLNQIFALFPHAYGASLSIVDGLTGNREKAFCIGAVFLFAGILFGVYWKDKKQRTEAMKLGFYCIISSAVLVFMSTIWFPWDYLCDLGKIPAILISRLQFPWRLLGTASCLLTVVACVVLKNQKETGKVKEEAIALLIMLGLTAITTGYFVTSLIEKNDVIYVADMESFSTFEVVGGEYLPVTVDRSEAEMPEGKVWHASGIQVTDQVKRGAGYTLSCINNSSEVQRIELPLIYYRGYMASDDKTGQKIRVVSGENGRVCLEIPENYQGNMSVKFMEPSLWRLAELISVLTLLGLLMWIIPEKDANRRRKRETYEKQ